MNTTNDKAHTYAIGSDAGSAWHKARNGRWTGSMIGDLMTTRALTDNELDEWGPVLCPDLEPYTITKTGKNAGEQRRAVGYASAVKEAAQKAGLVFFGDGALAAIASKAAERIAGETEHSAQTWSMTRGLELEPVARIILNETWRPVDDCPYCPLPGVVPAGATPDGLVDGGEAVLDIKCPERIGKLVQFATEVANDDFDALEAWDKGYAWQIMMEAKCAGVDQAWLVYFTDRVPAITDIHGTDIQAWVNEQTGNAGSNGYVLESGGVAYVARRFTLTPERSKRIELVLAAAEIRCDDMVRAMRRELCGGWDYLIGTRGTLTAVEVVNRPGTDNPADLDIGTVEGTLPSEHPRPQGHSFPSFSRTNDVPPVSDIDSDDDSAAETREGVGQTDAHNAQDVQESLNSYPSPSPSLEVEPSRGSTDASTLVGVPVRTVVPTHVPTSVPTPVQPALSNREAIATWVNDFINAAPDIDDKIAQHGIKRLTKYVVQWYEGIKQDL